MIRIAVTINQYDFHKSHVAWNGNETSIKNVVRKQIDWRNKKGMTVKQILRCCNEKARYEKSKTKNYSKEKSGIKLRLIQRVKENRRERQQYEIEFLRIKI